MVLMLVHLNFAGGDRWREEQIRERFHLACCECWPDLWIALSLRNISGPALYFSGINPCGTRRKGTIYFPWCNGQGQWSSSFWAELLRTVAACEGKGHVFWSNNLMGGSWAGTTNSSTSLCCFHCMTFKFQFSAFHSMPTRFLHWGRVVSVRSSTHLHLVLMLRMSGDISLLTMYASMARTWENLFYIPFNISY